jgi:hypothetical protein
MFGALKVQNYVFFFEYVAGDGLDITPASVRVSGIAGFPVLFADKVTTDSYIPGGQT